MHALLEKLLHKKNIESTKDLSEEEKSTFDKWEGILSEGEITLQKVVEYCERQIGLIEGQWKNLDNPQSKNDRLICMHTVYKSLLGIIQAPKAERQNLEKYLNDLLAN